MQEQELKQEFSQISDVVNSIVVNSVDTYEQAGNCVMELDSLTKKINDYWKEPIAKAHETHKSLTEKRNEMLKPVDLRRGDLRKKISVYLTEQDQIKRKQQQKLDEERRKKEQAEKEKLERAAQRAEEKGKIGRADALREKIDDVYIPQAIVESTVEKTTRTDAGTISQKKDIAVNIIDIKLLLKEIIDGRIPVTVIDVNLSKLKQSIKLLSADRVPGCEISEIITGVFRNKK